MPDSDRTLLAEYYTLYQNIHRAFFLVAHYLACALEDTPAWPGVPVPTLVEAMEAMAQLHTLLPQAEALATQVLTAQALAATSEEDEEAKNRD